MKVKNLVEALSEIVDPDHGHLLSELQWWEALGIVAAAASNEIDELEERIRKLEGSDEG